MFMLPVRVCHDSPSRVMASAKPSHLSAWENRTNRGTESCFPDLLGPRCHVASECLLLSGLCFLPEDEDTCWGTCAAPPRPLCGPDPECTSGSGEAAPTLWPLGSPAFAGALETGCWLDPFRGACSQCCAGPVPLGLHPVGAVRREEPPFSASQGRCVTPSGGWSPFAGDGPSQTCGPHPMCPRNGCGL